MYRLDFSAPIYLGTADDALQSNITSAEDSLTFEITLFTILGLTTIVGTPFLWQSAATLGALENRRALLESESGLRLAGRPGVTRASEYFRQRENDTKGASRLILRNNSPFKSERPGSVPLNWQHRIAPEVKVEPRPGSVEKYFRALFIDDTQARSTAGSILEATSHGFGARYSRRGRGRTDCLLNRIGEQAYSGHFSRAMIEHSFLDEDSYFSNLQEVLLRTSALYQAANGLAHEGVLFTTPGVLERVPKNIRLTALSRCSITPLNPYLFADVLRVVGVKHQAWIQMETNQVERVVNTVNPLTMFSDLYKKLLIEKIYYWEDVGFKPTYQYVVNDLRKSLFYENEWQFMERFSFLPGRKFDALAAGITLGAGAATFGQNPLQFGGAAKQIVEYGYKLIDGLSFFEVLRMRSVLKNYLQDMKLL